MSLRVEFRNLCRICLTEEIDLVDILTLGDSTEKWIEDIKAYYDVQVSILNIHISHVLLLIIDPFHGLSIGFLYFIILIHLYNLTLRKIGTKV